MAVKRDRMAHSLTQRLPKDVVAGAVYAKNCVEWVLCREVCAVMGLRFSPINLHLVASEVAYIVHDWDADMVFYTREFALKRGDYAGECADSEDVGLHERSG